MYTIGSISSVKSMAAEMLKSRWGKDADRLLPVLSAYRRNAGYYRKAGKEMPRVFYFDTELIFKEIKY